MKSESQNRKGKGGRKPKFDYTSEDFLSLVESYAKKGFTDKEIAYAIGILPQTFCELAPNLQAMSVWLYHHDEDWRKVERKQDEDADIPTDIEHGINIDSWIKDKLK